MIEKLEECPKCGERERWAYDSQLCGSCFHDRAIPSPESVAYKKRFEALSNLISRETDAGPVFDLSNLDDPRIEQRFFELLSAPVK